MASFSNIKNMKYLVWTIIWMTTLATQAQDSFIFTRTQTEQEILDITRIIHNEATLDSIVNRVAASSNLLKALDEEMKMYDEEILQKKRGWVTSFRFGVNLFSANTTADPYNESVTTYGVLPNIGLNFTLDPEKLVNRQSYVRQSISKKEYARYIQEDNLMTLKKDILNQYYDYLAFLESAHIRQLTYETRKQQVEYLDGLFRNGEINYSDLLLAENQLHLAKEAMVTTSISVMKKRSEIYVLTGLK